MRLDTFPTLEKGGQGGFEPWGEGWPVPRSLGVGGGEGA